MARHSKQNRFAGSIYVRHRLARGGKADVTERDVIAMDNTCWCGKRLGHNWPGKNEGAPHPREEKNVARTWEPITRNDMKKYDRPTQDLLLEIINEHKVCWRPIDGDHLSLYPPDGESRPFKVSAKRPTEINRQILIVQFMQEYGLRPKKEAKPVTTTQEKPVTTPVPTPPPTPAVTQNLEVVDLGRVVRQTIDTLTAALGVESLEQEALEAMEENDRLKRQVEALTAEASRARADTDRARSDAEACAREVDRLRDRLERANGLIDEAVAAKDKAEAKIATLKELFS